MKRTYTGTKDSKGRAILRGPRGGLYVLGPTGKRMPAVKKPGDKKPGQLDSLPPNVIREIAGKLHAKDAGRLAAVARGTREPAGAVSAQKRRQDIAKSAAHAAKWRNGMALKVLAAIYDVLGQYAAGYLDAPPDADYDANSKQYTMSTSPPLPRVNVWAGADNYARPRHNLAVFFEDGAGDGWSAYNMTVNKVGPAFLVEERIGDITQEWLNGPALFRPALLQAAKLYNLRPATVRRQ